MAKKFFTRSQIQDILETNSLKSDVYYLEREETNSPDNVIVYYRLSPNKSLFADDTIHIRKVMVQVTHFHKKKLDNIQDLMLSFFNCEPLTHDVKQIDTDYFATHYRFEVLTKGAW